MKFILRYGLAALLIVIVIAIILIVPPFAASLIERWSQSDVEITFGSCIQFGT